MTKLVLHGCIYIYVLIWFNTTQSSKPLSSIHIFLSGGHEVRASFAIIYLLPWNRLLHSGWIYIIYNMYYQLHMRWPLHACGVNAMETHIREGHCMPASVNAIWTLCESLLCYLCGCKYYLWMTRLLMLQARGSLWWTWDWQVNDHAVARGNTCNATSGTF